MSESIAEPMSDNEALRRILADLDEVIDIMASAYTQTDTADGVAVSDVISVVREADPDAIKTVVTNTGSKKILLYENASLVATLYADQTWESPLAGSLEITGKCGTGDDSTVSVTTYKA